MEALPGIWSLSPLGALIGAVITLYWLIGTGKLIPRSSHEREIAQANKRGDEWKDTALEGRKLIQEQSEQIDRLTKASETAAEFFKTVQGGGRHETSNTG